MKIGQLKLQSVDKISSDNPQIRADNKNRTNLLVRYEFFFITPGCR
ncbi:hypothetical protein METP3_02404 [Methanosarcinales archaeon]|nr:hypothetical protein METP3_02404 [Methanosarcinales archaeon]